ncbi:NUDIX hydrolase [Haloprofundus salilacus]|uniref:NUDIX hydrolase n=1 Tax=Haloprofundus salilacus TaxID=2876190 RepID=UPI001CCAD043|nr:NUDIX domain-containing protein [Haloprofundus salilacus]
MSNRPSTGSTADGLHPPDDDLHPPAERIRVVALGVVRRDDELLVFEGDSEESGTYYRPLGGGVEFGEHSVDALRREFREELEVELTQVHELGTFEDVFTLDGEECHEVHRVYGAAFVQQWPYQMDSFTGYEPELDEEFDCLWKPLSAFTDGEETLYPEKLPSVL